MNNPSEAPSHNSRTEWEKQHKAREITAPEWERQRATFTQLYLDGLDLTEVRRILAEEHSFYANEAQFKKKIKKWDLGKNLNKGVVAAMLLIRAQREALYGKLTNFEYRGRLVEEDKLQRSRKRLGLVHPSGEELNSQEVVTPLHVKYFTPSPKICASGTSSENHYQGDADDTHLPELVADIVSTLGSRDQSLLCSIYRGVYSGNEFIGGPIVDPAQRNVPNAADIIQPKEEAGDEIEQSSSDIQWKDPKRGDASTIGSWIRDDIVLSGSVFDFESQSLCPSSHLGQGIGFSCCGAPLASMRVLLDHFEGYHSQQKGSGAQGATGPTSSELDAEVMELEAPLEAMELEAPLEAMELEVPLEVMGLSPGKLELDLNRMLLRIGLLEEIASKMRGEVEPYVLVGAHVEDDQLLEEEMLWKKVRSGDGLLGTLF